MAKNAFDEKFVAIQIEVSPAGDELPKSGQSGKIIVRAVLRTQVDRQLIQIRSIRGPNTHSINKEADAPCRGTRRSAGCESKWIRVFFVCYFSGNRHFLR